MAKHIAAAYVLGFGMALSSCAGSAPSLGSQSNAVEVYSELPAPDPSTAVKARNSFVIGPFDTIQVAVLNAPELEREGMVDSSGNFSMPLIGSVQAGGRTPEELERAIADALRGKYVRDPQVTVSLTKVQSRTVTVDGAVRRSGVYPINDKTTLQQAVALAEGGSEFADFSEVVVFRTIDDRRMAALFDLEAIRAGQMQDPQIYGDDIVVVATNEGRRRFRDIVQSVPMLGVFTPVVR